MSHYPGMRRATMARALHQRYPMPASHRAIALTLTLSVLVACENPFANGAPPDSPGVAVPGVSGMCSLGSACLAWSADSKTLYVMATLGTSSGASLVAVDPLTRDSRIVGRITPSAMAFQPSADGTAIYFLVSTFGGNKITRMSLTDGSTATVATTKDFEFLVSPDGTALAYHAVSDSFPPDTVVLLDLPTGTRRATTVSRVSGLGAFSGDGARLLLNPFDVRTIHIWHVTTGARDTLPLTSDEGVVHAAAWQDGNFRLLIPAFDRRTVTDTSLAGGSAVKYSIGQGETQIEWLPNRSAIWAVSAGAICGSQGCNTARYNFAYSTATSTTTLGAAIGGSGFSFAASPDGHWIAHVDGGGPLYLLHQPTP